MDDGKEKPSFVIYRNWMEMVMALPDDTALDLTRTIFGYCLNRDYEPDPVAAAIFDTIEPTLERDIEKWYQVREERAKAGSLGGKQKVANAKQVVANAKQVLDDAKQNVPVYVNVNVDGNVNVDDNVLPSEGTKREDANASKRETRHKYGLYENVLLSDSDLEKLKSEFPTDWEERIERLSEYIESKGAKYKNHLATIRAWARKNGDNKKKDNRPYGFRVIDDMDWGNDSNGIDGQWEDVAGR